MPTTVTAKQLRYQTGRILQRVSAGERVTVTLRGREIAVILPLAASPNDYVPIGFGMWKNREDLKDIPAWINKIRQPRHKR